MNNLTVHRIAPTICKPWLLQRHYAKRLCSISYAFGLYDNVQLVGVCTFGKPASPSLCVGICGASNSKHVYELNRLVVDSDRKKNELSFFVGACLRLLPPMIIVSYADTKMNHHGYIYQATNWLYTGPTKARTDISTIDGKHSRHYNKTQNYAVNRQERSVKHRYVYIRGSKTQRKHWLSALNYVVQPYPKGQNKNYETKKMYTQAKLF